MLPSIHHGTRPHRRTVRLSLRDHLRCPPQSPAINLSGATETAHAGTEILERPSRAPPRVERALARPEGSPDTSAIHLAWEPQPHNRESQECKLGYIGLSSRDPNAADRHSPANRDPCLLADGLHGVDERLLSADDPQPIRVFGPRHRHHQQCW
jgi:hypothetical protein